MWNYDPQKRTTGDERSGLIQRAGLEEAIEALLAAGIGNRPLIVDVLTALSGLSRQEVSFNVNLACEAAGSERTQVTTAAVRRTGGLTKSLLNEAPSLR